MNWNRCDFKLLSRLRPAYIFGRDWVASDIDAEIFNYKFMRAVHRRQDNLDYNNIYDMDKQNPGTIAFANQNIRDIRMMENLSKRGEI